MASHSCRENNELSNKNKNRNGQRRRIEKSLRETACSSDLQNSVSTIHLEAQLYGGGVFVPDQMTN